MAANRFFGMVLYDIKENGRILNGLYTNSDPNNKDVSIFNEIARKNNNSDGINGEYTASWIESGHDNVITGILTFTTTPDSRILELEWESGGDIIFRGNGFILENQITAVYWIGGEDVTFSQP